VSRTSTLILVIVALAVVLSACSSGSPAQSAADQTFIDCMGDQGFKLANEHFNAQVVGDPPQLVVLSLLAEGDGLQAAAAVCIPKAERAVAQSSA